jgi:hypothetical protein
MAEDQTDVVASADEEKKFTTANALSRRGKSPSGGDLAPLHRRGFITLQKCNQRTRYRPDSVPIASACTRKKSTDSFGRKTGCTRMSKQLEKCWCISFVNI